MSEAQILDNIRSQELARHLDHPQNSDDMTAYEMAHSIGEVKPVADVNTINGKIEVLILAIGTDAVNKMLSDDMDCYEQEIREYHDTVTV